MPSILVNCIYYGGMYQVEYTPGGCNETTHLLAKLAMKNPNVQVWMEAVVKEICNVVLQESKYCM